MSYGQQRKPSFLDDYIGVSTRVDQFYERFPDGRILTEQKDAPEGCVAFKSSVYRNADDAEPSATGHAMDKLDLNSSTYEKTETAAVGRALAFLNFETKKGIASREEMERVQTPRPVEQSQSPVANNMSDLVTPKQLVAIRAIANVVAVNAEEECAKQYECKPEELSRRGASAFIDHLKTLGTDPPRTSNVSPIRRQVDTDETPQQRFERATEKWQAQDRNRLLASYKGNYAQAADEAETANEETA